MRYSASAIFNEDAIVLRHLKRAARAKARALHVLEIGSRAD